MQSVNPFRPFSASWSRLLISATLMAFLSCATFASAQSVFVEGVNSEFGTVDVTTGVFTSLGTTAVPLDGLAFNSSGTLFGSDLTASTLYTVNPTNGVLTLIGSTGAAVAPGSAALALTFSPSGTLFLLDQDPVNNTTLFTIDPATGLATLVGPTGHISSGSAAFVGSTLYENNNEPGAGIPPSADILNVLDQATGVATPLPFSTSVIDIFALVNVGGTLYGFDAANQIVTLDTSLGTSTFQGTYALPGGDNIFAAAFSNRPTSTPEPGSVALLAGMGLSGADFLARRRKQMRQAL